MFTALGPWLILRWSSLAELGCPPACGWNEMQAGFHGKARRRGLELLPISALIVFTTSLHLWWLRSRDPAIPIETKHFGCYLFVFSGSEVLKHHFIACLEIVLLDLSYPVCLVIFVLFCLFFIVCHVFSIFLFIYISFCLVINVLSNLSCMSSFVLL